ncbi:fatty acid desaturase [Micromonospora kangleipakensis]|uniref:Fatty acid desaturase n=1 Tax=Micromonospora kangleipakensis TaxID=1077942 RepID=A0A4Q8BA97_9ACTN|nr:acyl-CoA desaturase [Micromonospora kangleipakensis]RZU74458.1 fatty acid desaturase [Micromonospora kangleipakensis]
MSDATLDTERHGGSPYADLSRLIRRAGLLDRRRGYYSLRISALGGCYVGAWTLFGWLGESWWQLGVAAALAMVFGQAGFIGHDAGHRQIFRSRRANDLVGLAHGNLLIGISYGWWVDKHNRHHAHPNTEGRDPDIVVRPLSFTPGQARKRRGLGALVVRYQAYLFFPLLLLEGLHLHANSVRAVVGPSSIKRRPAEAALLALHATGYLGAVVLVLSPMQAVAFILVNQGLLGLYLGSAFAPNHKGMPILAPDERLDYLRRQVLTSRNVRGGWFIDTLLGGLNYQIEHHLFPSMPRPNLRRARPLVHRFCAEHDITYHETTLMRSWAQALKHLREVGSGQPADDAGSS